MKSQITLQNMLKERLQEAQKINPRYSLRAFSKKVGIHFATLSAIMNGRRVVSKKIAESIADRLGLNPQERSELLSLFPEPKSKLKNLFEGEEPKKSNYKRFTEEQFPIAQEWEYFATLSLLQCNDFESSSAWVANRLGISIERAQDVIGRLIAVGLINVDENGKYVRSSENYCTTDDVAQTILKKSHEQSFHLAKESLHRDPVDKRDFTAVTVAVNPNNMRTAKELIRKFQDDLCDKLEEGSRSEVYRLSIQLFPLSQILE